MNDYLNCRSVDVAQALDGAVRTTPCPIDECGCARVSGRDVARLGLRPLDKAALAFYPGIICLWRELPSPRPAAPSFLDGRAVRVDHDGTVTVLPGDLRRAGLLGQDFLITTAWFDEVSVS